MRSAIFRRPSIQRTVSSSYCLLVGGPLFFFFKLLGFFFFFFNFGFIYLFIYLFIYGCVGSSFLVRGLSLVVARGGHSSSWCAGLSLSRPLFLRSTGSRCAGSVIVAHGPSCSVARGILPDQGSNPHPLHWQADSQPLRHQGSQQEDHFCMSDNVTALHMAVHCY